MAAQEIIRVVPALDADALARCIDIRREVFIAEQGVPEAEEIDGRDPDCTHFLALEEDTPVGCARLLVTDGGEAKAQRVAVLKSYRGRGVGVLIMRALEDAAQTHGHTCVILGAQLSAVPFYERIGYVAYGDVFLDAGIEHRMMRRPLAPKS